MQNNNPPRPRVLESLNPQEQFDMKQKMVEDDLKRFDISGTKINPRFAKYSVYGGRNQGKTDAKKRLNGNDQYIIRNLK